MSEADEASMAKKPRDWSWLTAPLRRCVALAGRALLVLLESPFRRRRADAAAAAETGTPISRALRGLAYRLMFLPILLTLLASLLVYLATHPRAYIGDLDPLSVGVYYDPVILVAADGVRSEAWLAPALDARKIVTGREQALRRRSPGVVLVHDMGQTSRQMLPLVRPLHEAGYVVLVVGVRGSGGAEPVGQTFGLNEALDVRAAIDMLRRRSFVDPRQIAVIGVGTGGTAALLAREQDPTLSALVLIDLPEDTNRLIGRTMSQRSPLLKWLTPICRWTFEVAYQGSLTDLDTARLVKSAEPAKVLQLGGVLVDGLAMKPERAEPITSFMRGIFGRTQLTRAE